MAVGWCSLRFVLVVFSCYASAQPNLRFPPYYDHQPQDRATNSQWPQTPQRPETERPQKQSPQRPESQWLLPPTPQRLAPQWPLEQIPPKPEPKWTHLLPPKWPGHQRPQQQTPQIPEQQWPLQPIPQWPEHQRPQQQMNQRPQPQISQKQDPQWSHQQIPRRPEPYWPLQPTLQRPAPDPEKPQKQSPQRPEPQWPLQSTPQRPAPQWPLQPTPQRPAPQWPLQPTPERSAPQWPLQPTPQRPAPQWPLQPTPERSAPQWPLQPTPERPAPQWPLQPSPQRPAPQWPLEQIPIKSDPKWPSQPTPKWPGHQRTQQQTPQRLEPQWPLQVTPQWPEHQRPQQQIPLRPQLPVPQKPDPQWPEQQPPKRSETQWPHRKIPPTSQPLTYQRVEPYWPQPQFPQRPGQKIPQRLVPQRPAAPTTLDQRCQVQAQNIVKCGTPKITQVQCEAIDCCYNGQQCYYGKAVTVQCTKDAQFVVVVSREATWPKINIDSISLLGGNDSPCIPVGITSAFAIYQFPVTACGTTLKEESGYVVYENRMASSYEVLVGPRGYITRDSHFELLFQCRYSANAVEALVLEVNSVPAPVSVAALGPLRVQLRLARGACDVKGCRNESRSFASYYTQEEYPVIKVLKQPVYVEVRILERKDPNLVLMLDYCWATSSPSPVSMPQWELLIEECPYQNDRYLTTMIPVEHYSGLLYPTHHKRFIVEMFTFVDHNLAPQKDLIFIHCSTSVCHPTPEKSCQQKCNRQRSNIAVARDRTRPTSVVSSGEVVLVNKKPA